MRQTAVLKNAEIKSVAGRLVARDNSRHYWLFNGSKWQRLGLKAIATMLPLSIAVISVMFRMVNSTKQAVKHLPVTDLAVYTVLFIICFIGVSLACQGDVLMMQGHMHQGICQFVTGTLVSGVSILGVFKAFDL